MTVLSVDVEAALSLPAASRTTPATKLGCTVPSPDTVAEVMVHVILSAVVGAVQVTPVAVPAGVGSACVPACSTVTVNPVVS